MAGRSRINELDELLAVGGRLDEALLEEAGRNGLPRTWVTAAEESAALHQAFGPDLTVLDARADGDHASQPCSSTSVAADEDAAPAWVVFDGLDRLSRRLLLPRCAVVLEPGNRR